MDYGSLRLRFDKASTASIIICCTFILNSILHQAFGAVRHKVQALTGDKK